MDHLIITIGSSSLDEEIEEDPNPLATVMAMTWQPSWRTA